MREIKFRWYVKPTAEDYFLHEDEPMTYSVSDIGGWLRSSDYKNGHVIAMQYTGLKDKNSTDIYEGDLLQDGSVRVVWKDAGFWGQIGNDPSNLAILAPIRNLEVIGNIYENPELLEKN